MLASDYGEQKKKLHTKFFANNKPVKSTVGTDNEADLSDATSTEV